MMSTFFKTAQLSSVIVLGITWTLASHTLATEIKPELSSRQTVTSLVPLATTQNAIAQSPQEMTPSSHKTEISEQADVNPNSTPPAAGYGCISGYTDRTFQGNQPISRDEFAAGLNACLNRVEQLIDGSTAALATQEDLAVSKQQLANLRSELERLRLRVDGVGTENKH